MFADQFAIAVHKGVGGRLFIGFYFSQSGKDAPVHIEVTEETALAIRNALQLELPLAPNGGQV